MMLSMGDWVLILVAFFTVIAYAFYQLIVKYKRVTGTDRRPVVVTGCDSGFGRELALRLMDLGVPVIATCLFDSSCQQLTTIYQDMQGLATDGKKFFALQMDVRSPESVEKVVQHVKNHFPQGLWGLVCNAGVLGKPCPDDWLNTDDFMETISVNLLGSIRCVQMFKPLLRQMQGRIVFVSSVTGKSGLPGIAPYTVSKFGIEGYAQSLRHEIRAQRIKVVVLEPGFHGTSLSHGDAIKRTIDQCWNRLSPYYKELYGEGYEQKMYNAISSGLISHNRHDFSWILDSFEHSLLAQFPKYRYRVGWDAVFQFHPLTLLPEVVQDVAIDLFYYILNVPYPEYTKYL